MPASSPGRSPAAMVIEHESKTLELPNDVMIVRIGGEAPYPFLQRIGVRIVRKEIAIKPTTHESAA